MLTCARTVELLQARMDGELDVEEAIELGAHINSCLPCQELVKDLEQLCALTVQLPRHEAEGSLARRTLDNISPPAAAWPVISWRYSLAIGLVASVAVVFVAFMFFSTQQSQPQSQPIIPIKVSIPAPPVATVASIQFDGDELIKDACVQQCLAKYRRQQRLSKEEREQEQQLAQLLRELRFPKKAGNAAAKLADMSADKGGRILWNLAAAVTDPRVSAEVFNAIAQRQPELRLAPVYIAALGSAQLKQKATIFLCAVSGKKYGPYPERWLAWWAAAKAQTEKKES
ncbi:MAG: zf-HC2 domain-containing protein [Planctomycetota bacterium]